MATEAVQPQRFERFTSALQVPGQWLEARIGARAKYLLTTVLAMVALYTVLYHPYEATSLPGRMLHWYLEQTAAASAVVLQLAGEAVTLQSTRVLGRFPYVVVLDCAALDATALYAAAVIAFPVRLSFRLAGVLGGIVCIFIINVARLVVLYFAGIQSRALFHTLHEEVFVFLVIGLVCLIFLGWAQLARRRSDLEGT